METIYMILAVAVFIAAIAVAFEWGYYKGMRDEIIQVKKPERCETKIGDSSASPAKSYRSAKPSETLQVGQSPFPQEIRCPKGIRSYACEILQIERSSFPKGIRMDDKMLKAQKGKQKKSPREETEKARYDAILANIDNYTGDSKGQKEVISGGKEIL